jgi:hypothetical protein
MPRWRKGEDTINTLLERAHLQQVTADTDIAETLVAASERHVHSAASLVDSDPEAAFSLAYDAARKAATALLASAPRPPAHHRRRPHRRRRCDQRPIPRSRRPQVPRPATPPSQPGRVPRPRRLRPDHDGRGHRSPRSSPRHDRRRLPPPGCLTAGGFLASQYG